MQRLRRFGYQRSNSQGDGQGSEDGGIDNRQCEGKEVGTDSWPPSDRPVPCLPFRLRALVKPAPRLDQDRKTVVLGLIERPRGIGKE